MTRKVSIDASIVCFALVVLAAIPVAALRSRTYALGYDLGQLKKQEKSLKLKNIELKSSLAQTQRVTRDRYLGNSQSNLSLPKSAQILHNGEEP